MTRVGPVAAATLRRQFRELDVCTIPSIPLGGMRGGFEPFSCFSTDSVPGKIFSYPQIPAKSLKFRNYATEYWNKKVIEGPNGEEVSFNVQFSIIKPGEEVEGRDTLVVKTAVGSTHVDMTLAPGKESSPDTGVIFTFDGNRNPSHLRGIAPHEAGHLMGLRDLYSKSEKVPINSSPEADIMRHSQPGNSPLSASWIFYKYNGNVTRKKRNE